MNTSTLAHADGLNAVFSGSDLSLLNSDAQFNRRDIVNVRNFMVQIVKTRPLASPTFMPDKVVGCIKRCTIILEDIGSSLRCPYNAISHTAD